MSLLADIMNGPAPDLDLGIWRPPDHIQLVVENLELAYFALGWFWSAEAAFGSVVGVALTRVGYAGGTKISPTYYSLGDHSESVEVCFHPSQVSFLELLKVFWKKHDPMRRTSPQYRSKIFFTSDAQAREATSFIARKSNEMRKRIPTEVAPISHFYPAEWRHQKHCLRRHPSLLQVLTKQSTQKIDSLSVKDARCLSVQQLWLQHALCKINAFVGCPVPMAVFQHSAKELGLTSPMEQYIRDVIIKGVS